MLKEFKELGFNKEYLEKLKQKIDNGEDPVLAIAKSKINTTKVKILLFKARKEAVNFSSPIYLNFC